MRKALLWIVPVLLVGASAGAWFATRRATTTITTTTTRPVPHYPTAPLTGLVDTSGLSVTRPALTVKIENTPDALPQWGVDRADVVYEEIVNGGITRLAAIFNSQAPLKVGPVRSVRPTDTQIVWPLGGIFAYSGGAAYAVASISSAPVKLVDESSAGSAMFRDPTRYAPHNLYASAPGLFAIGGAPVPPKALFVYASTPSTSTSTTSISVSKSATTGSKVSSFVVPFPSMYPVTWTWDAVTSSWDRTLFGRPDITGTGVRESPKSVVVMWVNYVNGIGTMASYGDLQSGGPVAVFTNGHEVQGTWHRRASKADVITYAGANGRAIAVTPGQTWVELLNSGTSLTVTK